MVKKEDALFSDDVTPTKEDSETERWKVLVVDDEQDVHVMTRLALEDFNFRNKKINLISAYSSEQAKELIAEHPDTALIILDVVMEKEDSGLDFVKYLRQDLKNNLVRVILRTGQPGYAPERSVIINYDINDYKEKTELTATKFFTAVVMALRSFVDLESLASEREAIKQQALASERFVPRNFLKLLGKESIVHVKLGDNVEQDMTVLFLDIRSFTSIAEKLTPKQTFEFINNVLSYFEPVIIENEGFIDKYIGDAVMALFCGPADAALETAIGLFKMQDKYNRLYTDATINIGIGINSGNVMVGSIGFHDRLECTVISDVVNIAARLEKVNVIYGTRILISDQVIKRLANPQQFKFRSIGDVFVKGKLEAIKVYEVIDGEPDDIAELKWKTKKEFETGLKYFYERHYEEARECFEKVLKENPSDTVATFYCEGCAQNVTSK